MALVTPFRDGAVDVGAVGRLCERQVERGSAAILVGGSLGEGTSLSIDEHGMIIAMAVAAGRRAPIIAGCSAPAIREAVALAGNARRHGAAGLLCTPPTAGKPTQADIRAHVQAVAQAADLPVMLCDGRAGLRIADETVAELFDAELIIALQDASGDLARATRLRALCGEGLLQMSGDDATACAHLAMGGEGCVSVMANVAPALCAQLQAAWRCRDLEAFARIRDLLAPLHDALGPDDPAPVKAALATLRLCGEATRTPPARGAVKRDRLVRALAGVLAAEEASCGRPHLTLVR